MVFLGLPHGALDHLVMPWERRGRASFLYLAVFFAGYLGLTVCYLGFWRVLPVWALGVFLLLSWLHWGQGDAWAVRVFLGRGLGKNGWRTGLVWAVRGALPIVLPPLAFPHVFAGFTRGMLAWYGHGMGGWALTPGVRVAGFTMLGLLGVCYALSAWGEYGRANRRGFWVDVREVVLLTVFFLRVPPVLAVGVYFCVWHAARHLGRLMLLDPVCEGWLGKGRLGRSAARTAALCLPLTVAALGLLGGLYEVAGHRAADAGAFVWFYLSLVAALTFPHFLLVAWMDWREGTPSLPPAW